MNKSRVVRNVAVVLDSKGKVQGITHNCTSFTVLKGWTVLRGQFVSYKKQKPLRLGR